MTRFVINTLVYLLLAAVAAQAQLTTPLVKVHVPGKGCDKLEDVYLVINGDDVEDRWVKLQPTETCHWQVNLGDGTVSTSTARFSLRAGVARSDCQKAAAIANDRERFADLEFSCCKGTFRKVGVKIEPPIPVTYVRNVQPDARARVRGVPCIERATFDEGQGAISSAQFSGEDVYLQLWPVGRKLQTAGLLLDDIATDKGPRVLNRDDVAQRLMVQRAQGKAAIKPSLSSNALSLDLRKLAEVNFQRAQIEVIK